jgi:hypothetical protein
MNNFMKANISGSAPNSARGGNSSCSRLWAALHTKPAPPIGHPIPQLTPQPVPPPRKAKRPSERRPAAPDYLSRFLCAAFAVALLTTGCATPGLKGGKAVTTHKPSGVVEQTLLQGESAAAATKQDQESVKVRTYTVPAGSQVWEGERPREPKLSRSSTEIRAREDTRPPGSRQPSNLSSQPSTTFVLSAPMSVVEREESRARTELGAAQKDPAREVGAKLASLKGVVWVGVSLFVFGVASLVWLPLKVVIGSVTTSAAIMAGGVCLVVLPSLIVGNELVILSAVALAVGGWFLAHRHGELRGSLKSKG